MSTMIAESENKIFKTLPKIAGGKSNYKEQPYPTIRQITCLKETC